MRALKNCFGVVVRSGSFCGFYFNRREAVRVYQAYAKVGNNFPSPRPIMDLGRGNPLSSHPLSEA